MNPTRTCPKCAAPLPADAPQGHCPQCLLALALEAQPGDATKAALEQATLDSGSSVAKTNSPALQFTPGEKVRYFGDYELLAEIARGGMGVVWKARQVSLNRTVALKMILSGSFASDAEIKRFRTEAEAAANLDHSHIVPIYEVGEHEGRHYFSMKLIEGGNLADRMRQVEVDARNEAGAFPLSQRIELLALVARAVHYAHQRGILHRDLKPANILLDADGQPHITDFGLAKLVNQDTGLTRTEAVMGTPAYMAPEQAQGRAKELTTAADIYSLGAMLYHLLAGRLPFVAETPLQVMRCVVEDEPANPGKFMAHRDYDLETICLKCLEKDPKRRYGSAEALADELERWQRNEPILARPVATPERVAKWAQRKPALAALVLVTVLAAVGGVTGLLRYGTTLREHSSAINERLHLTLIEQARAERLLGHRETALQRIADAAAIKRTDALRTEAIQIIAQPGLRPAFDAPMGAVAVSRFSADGRLLAVGGGGFVGRDWPGFATNAWQQMVRVWEVPSGKLLAALPWHLEAGTFALSPDARLLAVPQLNAAGLGELALWEMSVSNVTARLPVSGPSHFSPDGKFLAVQETNSVSVFQMSGATMPATRHDTRATIIAWTAPDILLLQEIPAEGHGRLFHWNVTTGAKTHPLNDTAYVRKPDRWFPPQPLPGNKLDAETEEAVTISADGRVAVTHRLTARRDLDELVIRELATGKKLGMVKPTPFPDLVDEWAPVHLLSDHGRRLVFPDAIEPGRMRVYDVNREQFLSSAGEPGIQLHLARPFERFGLGQNAGSGTSGSGVDEIRYQYWYFNHPSKTYSSPATPWVSAEQNFNPDSTLLATGMAGSEQGVALWELDSGRRVASITGAQRPVWSADGRWLTVAVWGMIAQQGGGARSGEIQQVREVLRGVPTHRLPNPPRSIELSSDGRQLVAADGYASILWDVEHSAAGVTLHATTNKLDGREAVLRTNATWLLNGFHFHSGNSLMQVSRLDSPEKPFSLEDLPLRSGSLRGRVISPDGQRLIFACDVPKWMTNAVVNRPHFQVWDLATRKRLAVWPHPEEAQHWGETPLVLSPDGRHLASAFFSANGIEIWEVATGKRLHKLHPPLVPPAPTFPRPSFFARLRAFLPFRPGPPPAAMPSEHFVERGVSALAFTPDSRLVISCAQGRAVIREVDSGRERAQFPVGTNGLSIAISPDGRTLAIGSEDRSLSLWEIPSGRELARWPAHDAPVKALTFSPDGTTLASGGGEGTMKLWNLPFIRRELARLKLDW